MTLDMITRGGGLGLAWVGSSVAAIDLGVVALDLVDKLPSEQLFGPEISGILVIGYVLAGFVALLGDLGVIGS